MKLFVAALFSIFLISLIPLSSYAQDCRDTDGDGVCDAEDPCPLDNPDDADGDGTCDSAGTCKTLETGRLRGLCNAYCKAMDCEGSPKASKKACNVVLGRFLLASEGVQPPCMEIEPPVETDFDNDGIADDVDNCPDVYNPDQTNSDIAVFGNNDLHGDACDNCPDKYNPEQSDTDGDGVGNLCDNCSRTPNPGQEDTYGIPGLGDACEPAQCVPSCDGKSCGGNGCGGSCGECGAGTSCSAESMCVSTPEACDGIDNDGNGQIDENLIPPQEPCQASNAYGTCVGEWQCGGGTGWSCDAQPPLEQDGVCP